MVHLDYQPVIKRRSRFAGVVFVYCWLVGPVSAAVPWALFGDVRPWGTYGLSRWVGEGERDLVIRVGMCLSGVLVGWVTVRRMGKGWDLWMAWAGVVISVVYAVMWVVGYFV